MPVKKDNKTIIEKDDKLTKIEEDSSFEKSGREGNGSGHISAKTIKLGGIVYEVAHRLDVASAEADLYLIKGASNEQLVLKYYRPKIEPKSEVIELLKSFSGHGAVRIIETGRESGRFYEIQEYAEHGTLFDFLKNNNRISREFMTEFIKNANECLFEIHSKNLIHRDIKPTNILMRKIEPPDIVLTDFGISSISEMSLHQTNMNRTILYSSPESMSGVISKATDYWSLGMILLEMVAGKNPFDGIDDRVVMFTLATKNVPRVMELKSEFAGMIRGLLTRDPKKRWGHSEIVSWLAGDKNIPVFFGEASDEIIQSRQLRPYRFEGTDYFTLRDLTIPMAKNWGAALKDFESGAIRNWVARELGDKEMLALIEDLAADGKLGLSEKLFEFFCRIDGDFPFIFKGILISRESLIELASKIIKNSASHEEEKFMKDIFELNIIKKYSDLNNDGSIYKLFSGIIETCYYFSEPADYAAAVLAHFSGEYKQALVEKAGDIFRNCYILDPPDGETRQELIKTARRICDEGQYSIKELIKLSKLDERNYIKKTDFDSAVAELKRKFIKLDEENQIKCYKEMLSDEDWKVIMAIVRKNKVEYSRMFYEKIAGIIKLFDGGTPSPERKINEIYYQHNYTEIDQLPLEAIDPPPETIGPNRAKPRLRFCAMACDMAIALLAVLFLLTVFIAISPEPLSLVFVIFFLKGFFLLFFLAYIPLFEFYFFASPGKMMCDLAVAGPNGRKMAPGLSFSRSFLRFIILSLYGYLISSSYIFFFKTDFLAPHLNIKDGGIFMQFFIGGIFECVFMSFNRKSLATYDTITGCIVAKRKRNVEWFWVKSLAVLYIAIMAFSWTCFLAPHLNFQTMNFGQYTLRYFIDPGSENGVKYGAGKQEIVIAASNGDFELVKYLIYAHPECVNIKDQNGYSALFFAAQKGNSEVAKLLLDNNAEVNVVGAQMETPLTAACAIGNSKIVKMLCAKKADIDFRNALGQTPIIIAARAKMFDALKRLAEAGAPLETKDNNGFTALATAAFNSDAQIFRYLVSKGADVKTADSKGNSLLIIAAVKNNFEIAEMLLRAGCDINSRDESGNATPLIAAIQNGNYKFAGMLIERSANVNLSDSQGNSPLMIAAAKGNPGMITDLINRGADVNHQSYSARNTALMVAASTSNEEIVRLLINAGADTKLRNSSGRSAAEMLGRAHGYTIEILRGGGR